MNDSAQVEMKLELVSVPVSDIDRAKEFYVEKAGFNADHDHSVSDEIRFVQLTLPARPASIAIGKGLSDMETGIDGGPACSSSSEIEAAREALAGRGVRVSPVQDFPWGRFRLLRRPRRQPLGGPGDPGGLGTGRARRAAKRPVHGARMAPWFAEVRTGCPHGLSSSGSKSFFRAPTPGRTSRPECPRTPCPAGMPPSGSPCSGRR